MVSFRESEVFFWLFNSNRGKGSKRDRLGIATSIPKDVERSLPTRRDRPRDTTSQMIHLPCSHDVTPFGPEDSITSIIKSSTPTVAHVRKGRRPSRQMEKRENKRMINGSMAYPTMKRFGHLPARAEAKGASHIHRGRRARTKGGALHSQPYQEARSILKPNQG